MVDCTDGDVGVTKDGAVMRSWELAKRLESFRLLGQMMC